MPALLLSKSSTVCPLAIVLSISRNIHDSVILQSLESFEQRRRLQRAVSPALVLSIAPLCFILRRTCKKWSPIVSN
uniref:Uncharacterized protein n=1 Tax=Arundo donax TaxID=35708 RepID=A0A0A9CMJ1_ARUDO